MRKTFKFYFIIWVISVLIFNIIAFVTTNSLNAFSDNFWISYIFITIAFIGQLGCSYVAFKSDNLQKTFYNITLVLISYITLAMFLIIGSLCIIIPSFPVWLGVILNVLLLGISTIITLFAHFAIETVSKIDNELKTKTFLIKSLTADAEHLISVAQTAEIRNECKKVYEALRYSDPMGNVALYELNEQIQRQFVSFEDAVNSADLELAIMNSKELLIQIDKRNKQCKLLK